jgi:hypothetical protein
MFDKTDSINIFKSLYDDVAVQIGKLLSETDLSKLVSSSPVTYGLFNPSLLNSLALKAREYVVGRNIKTLLLIAKAHPDVLFAKGQVTDPRKRNFYNVSAYQLLAFLLDNDMKNQIMSLIPERLKETCLQQDAEIGCGGADILKLNFDPMLVENFKQFTELKKNYTLLNDEQCEITFPLLENPNGIIYYQDDNKMEHFYYVERETQKIRKLEISLNTEQEKQAWNIFKASFASMENNSARCSSNKEHELITKILQCTLYRTGVKYEQNGILYRNSHSSFELINAYRKFISLHEQANDSSQRDAADTYWREVVGKAQGDEIWLLQRLCEQTSQSEVPGKEFTFYNFLSGENELIYSSGCLDNRLGINFTLYKGDGLPEARSQILPEQLIPDLIAVSQYVKEAKIYSNEFQFELGCDRGLGYKGA